jgi:WXG100 family type VII secretion target
MDPFQVDLKRLSALLERMARFDRTLEAALADADRDVVKLHRTWTGAAAEAQRRSHAEWQQGAADLRTGLAALARGIDTAQQNYRAAGETNAMMWRQAR